MNAFSTLFRTEVKLAMRGGDMPLFGVGFPIGVMLLVGFISKPESILLGFGGIAAVGICATGFMGIPLSFAAYRHEKILKRFRVTPASPALLLMANAAMQCLFCWISACAVFLIARLAFGMDMAGTPARYIVSFLFVQFSVYGIGFLIAGLVPNLKTANLICTLVYFPTLFLSGATVPYEIMPRGLQVFSNIFPLTQGIKILKGAVLGSDPGEDLVRILVLGGIGVISYVIALVSFRWE